MFDVLFSFRLSAFCWVVEDFISNLQYMLYRLQFALDMAGYLFIPFHSKSIVHVKNRVPSIAAIDLLLQLSSCARVLILHNMSCRPRKVKLSEPPILMRTRFNSSCRIFKKNTTLLSDFDESQVTKRKRDETKI